MGIDTCDKNGETALFVAVRNGDLEMAEYLLKKGINTFIFNNKNRSADFVAMEYFVDFDNQVSDDLSVIPSALLDKEYYSSLERRYKILSLIREHQKKTIPLWVYILSAPIIVPCNIYWFLFPYHSMTERHKRVGRKLQALRERL